MSEIVISVLNATKSYRIYDQPQDRLKQMLFARLGKSFGHDFFALRNVSFSVLRGETVGIIGRNGSGKSTLLQIIAGTLQPTDGEVEVNGKISALLELKSGFNPEFSGRENVYLNGAILGLGRDEMEARFDRIASFAEIGAFMEQPLKTYSTGMAMRLAFAVQAMVESDILIVDEVLAVGDQGFQRKCFARLEEFRSQSGTVLLVSHDIQTIVKHCDRCLLLLDGELIADGPPKPITDLYQKLLYSEKEQWGKKLERIRVLGWEKVLAERDNGQDTDPAPGKNEVPIPQTTSSGPSDDYDPGLKATMTTYGNGGAEIYEFGLYNELGHLVNIVFMGRKYRWRYLVRFNEAASDVIFGMMLKTIDGIDVSGINTDLEHMKFEHVNKGAIYDVSFDFIMNIIPGTYLFNAGVSGRIYDEFVYFHRIVDAAMIKVISESRCTFHGLAYLYHNVNVKII